MSCCNDGGVLNTGLTNKNYTVSDGLKLWYMQRRADDGTFNGIPQGTQITDAYLTSLIENPDPSKRLYPIGVFRQMEDQRGDAVTESFTDGSSDVTQQGIRAVNGWLVGFPTSYISVLESMKCNQGGFFTTDECGNITGSIASDGSLRPIQINPASIYAPYDKKTDTTIAKIRFQFEFSQLEKDSKLRIYPPSLIDSNVDVNEYEGLKTAFTLSGDLATTGFIIVAYAENGQANGIPVEGWLEADFNVYNNTTEGAVVLDSVTETSPGIYTFDTTTTPMSAGDSITVSGAAIKDTFELQSVTFEIPTP